MTFLGYEVAQLRKTVVALVVAAFALLGLFVAFDPNLQEATIAFVLAAFNVLAVFQATAGPQDIGKAVKALVASGLALVGFFHAFSPEETEKILAAVGALVNVLGVFWVGND